MINFPSLVATNASRMKMAAGPEVSCIEFGLRRAQGPNGACLASKYSYVGGFDGTSNVYSAYVNPSIPVLGTQAHSFIMSFESIDDIAKCRTLDGVDLLEKALAYRKEMGKTNTVLNELYAFVAYAVSYPTTFNALVDSYSTMDSGCFNFIVVAAALKDLGYEAKSIRLDSGDLAGLSAYCKLQFATAADYFKMEFFRNVKVVASNDINEVRIREFKKDNHQIDVMGIGTNLVTCQA